MVLSNEPKNRDVLLALTETYHRMSMKDQRNKTVETMLCLKENKTWNEYIAEAAQNNASNPYIVNMPKLLPIISHSLRDMEP
jgi:outer membrane protein assembly factor BamD (BamD/ComL family)